MRVPTEVRSGSAEAPRYGPAPTAEALRLQHVLAGQRFPAERWELLTCAEFYGADERSRRDLWALPAGRYRNLAEVLRAVQRAHTDVPRGGVNGFRPR